MTLHRLAWPGLIALLGAAACDSAPYDFGSMDARVGDGKRVEMMVPDPPALLCDDTGHVPSPASCPATALDGSQCANELDNCDIRSAESGSIASCVCLWAADGVKRWSCENMGAASTLGCPEAQPKAGESCTTALSCVYFGRPTCSCPTVGLSNRAVRCQCGQDLTWSCGPIPGADPRRGCSASPGSPLDATKRIADLTEAEALRWCEWAVHNVPGMDLLDPPPAIVADGYATASSGGQYYTGYPSLPMCWIRLPHDLCVRNLKLDTCAATVEMLDDCLLTSGTLYHGRGCGPFMLAPGCQRTFFQATDPAAVPPSCPIPVE